jgi:hypothetical protein
MDEIKGISEGVLQAYLSTIDCYASYASTLLTTQ